jgi:hypothetical protein
LILNATFVGAPLRKIMNSSYGYVLSVYDRTLNLILSGRLVTVSSNQNGRGPFIINVVAPDDFSFRSLNLLEGSVAECSSKHLRLSESKITINMEQAEQYNPSINIKAYDKTKVSANLELVIELITDEGSHLGVGEILRCLKDQSESNEAGNNVSMLALPYVRQLLSAIKIKNTKEMSYCLEHLIGLGPGTTPSCDDMLCGMMLAMKAFSSYDIELHRKVELFCSLTRKLAGRTNLISREYILYASFGQANEVAASALESLQSTSEESLMQRFRQLLAIGESSGTDIAVGLVLGTELCVDN